MSKISNFSDCDKEYTVKNTINVLEWELIRFRKRTDFIFSLQKKIAKEQITDEVLDANEMLGMLGSTFFIGAEITLEYLVVALYKKYLFDKGLEEPEGFVHHDKKLKVAWNELKGISKDSIKEIREVANNIKHLNAIVGPIMEPEEIVLKIEKAFMETIKHLKTKQ